MASFGSAWSRPFSAPCAPPQFRAFSPARNEIAPMLALAHRIASYVGEERAARRQPIFDLTLPKMAPPPRRATQGMPLGGIGCGALSRSSTGDFNRVDLQPGRCRDRVIAANQFSVRVGRRARGAARAGPASAETEAKVLSVLAGPTGDAASDPQGSIFGGSFGGDLVHWNWGALDPSKCTYHALFPLAWYVYEDVLPGLRLVCRQVNPVAPHDYSDASLPVAVFRWTLENTTKDEELDVSLMFTLGSGMEGSAAHEGSESTEPFAGSPFRSDDGKTTAGATLCGVELIPRTSLRPASLDSPTRCRPCTFREFAFLFLLFIVSLISGPVAILLFGYNLSWAVWMGATLLLRPQPGSLLSAMPTVRWCRRRPCVTVVRGA